MAFTLASPLAKFLNGLEILLCKAQVSTLSKISLCAMYYFVSELHSNIVDTFIYYVLKSSDCFCSSVLCRSFQDWENNASRSVSLRKELEPVTQLIIQWRKQELK